MNSGSDAVLDTNVLVSATFWKGASYALLLLLRKQNKQAILSTYIIDEYRLTLSSEEIMKKKDSKNLELYPLVESIIASAKIKDPTMIKQVCADPDDDPVIACATEANAAFLITQDKHLLVLEKHEGVRILTPEEFLRVVTPSQKQRRG